MYTDNNINYKDDELYYKNKYLKYKNKYLELKYENMEGGTFPFPSQPISSKPKVYLSIPKLKLDEIRDLFINKIYINDITWLDTKEIISINDDKLKTLYEKYKDAMFEFTNPQIFKERKKTDMLNTDKINLHNYINIKEEPTIKTNYSIYFIHRYDILYMIAIVLEVDEDKNFNPMSILYNVYFNGYADTENINELFNLLLSNIYDNSSYGFYLLTSNIYLIEKCKLWNEPHLKINNDPSIEKNKKLFYFKKIPIDITCSEKTQYTSLLNFLKTHMPTINESLREYFNEYFMFIETSLKNKNKDECSETIKQRITTSKTEIFKHIDNLDNIDILPNELIMPGYTDYINNSNRLNALNSIYEIMKEFNGMNTSIVSCIELNMPNQNNMFVDIINKDSDTDFNKKISDLIKNYPINLKYLLYIIYNKQYNIKTYITQLTK